ncbi:hypothetical protein K493DRAFT_71428 [Basidiobolus meristosporus CBS 931.73]|uniref:Uncharacterized protein n=1 Tax=Basidiobolus meristosporus CBS 931.73 TaxID=1314790 RepID=A0A1Y1XTT8_9FUNG|nr:hypothetical protein K493DRAFT_71428 [Basidiobolus meristosporus CBS 931.73]|eukprot:ORX89148.1 hypothetical protein K493DRAFT_71428 [Basidiobolus meristosporus CBS 931.73]
MSKELNRFYELLFLSLGILLLIKNAAAACSYSRDPGWTEPFKFNFKLNVCQTSQNLVTSKVAFAAQYEISGTPSQCNSTGKNTYQCVTSSDSIYFNLFTPGNSNDYPSLTVSVNNDQCSVAQYCSTPGGSPGGGGQDNGMLSLGPFGTYPKPAAIAGLCVFSLLILGGIYLVYRRQRTYSRTSSAEPGPRRNLWQLVCCSMHRQTGSRYGKSNNGNTKPAARSVGPKQKRNLEEGNPDYENGNNVNSLPLESVSINDLGSGVRNVPKSSVLVNLKEDVKKPSPSKSKTHRSSALIDSIANQKESNLEPQLSGTPTRSRTVKRNQTLLEKSRSMISEEQVEPTRGRNRNSVHANLDTSSKTSAAPVGRSKTTRENMRSKDQNRDVQRAVTTKRNEKSHSEDAKGEEEQSSRGRSKRPTRINDSDDIPLKAHRSKTIGGNSHRAGDKSSLSSKDSTPLGLLQRNKSLNLNRGNSTKEPANGRRTIPDDDDDVPLLPTPGKAPNTSKNATSAPRAVTNSHYSDDIINLYEDDKH